MARDEKRTDKGDDYEFVPPDFDEDAFIHREIVSFRTTAILFLWGIVAAVVSWGLFAAVDGAKVGWLLGLAVAAGFGLALKPIFPLLKADVKHFGRREWLGTGFLFFFTWLAFFILLVNPPVSDFAPPRVDVHASPAVQQAGGDVTLDAFFEDNHRVDGFSLLMLSGNGTVPLEDHDLGRGHHRYVAKDLPAGVYTIEATAEDARGHTQVAHLEVQVVERALTVVLPDGAALDAPNDEVFVQIGAGLPACSKRVGAPCVREVHLALAGGGQVQLAYDEASNGWSAVANHAGWRAGNVTFDVVADLMGTYAGSVFVDGGNLTSGPHTLQVTAPLGEYQPKVRAEPSAPTRDVPGLGLPLMVAALGAVALVLRRRR